MLSGNEKVVQFEKKVEEDAAKSDEERDISNRVYISVLDMDDDIFNFNNEIETSVVDTVDEVVSSVSTTAMTKTGEVMSINSSEHEYLEVPSATLVNQTPSLLKQLLTTTLDGEEKY